MLVLQVTLGNVPRGVCLDPRLHYKCTFPRLPVELPTWKRYGKMVENTKTLGTSTTRLILPNEYKTRRALVRTWHNPAMTSGLFRAFGEPELAALLWGQERGLLTPA